MSSPKRLKELKNKTKRLQKLQRAIANSGISADPDAAASQTLRDELQLLAEDQTLTNVFEAVVGHLEARLHKIKERRRSSD